MIIILINIIRSGRELGRVALPTVQRRLALSGKLCFNSLWPVTNVTGQGNGLRSRIVREKRAGPGITVKAKKQKSKKINNSVSIRYLGVVRVVGCERVENEQHLLVLQGKGIQLHMGGPRHCLAAP